jgi:hypothetical protein
MNRYRTPLRYPPEPPAAGGFFYCVSIILQFHLDERVASVKSGGAVNAVNAAEFGAAPRFQVLPTPRYGIQPGV